MSLKTYNRLGSQYQGLINDFWSKNSHIFGKKYEDLEVLNLTKLDKRYL